MSFAPVRRGIDANLHHSWGRFYILLEQYAKIDPFVLDCVKPIPKN